ncbi:unnamed protein product [Symbiodinium natans]|uniref:Uncharacterized protein n=1 Tax=Symbiodinium natans TaxID=878477 RepID=A0A812IIY1_9DINO|nr:unnamed protein product [Symbiodinium natans]
MPSFKTFADFQKKAQEVHSTRADAGEEAKPQQEELRIGLPVRVKGLQARPELNGLEGVLTFFDEQKSRWQVELKNGGGAKLFKAANLEHYISDQDALEILKSKPVIKEAKEPARAPVAPSAPATATPSEAAPEPTGAGAPKSFLERSRYGKAEGPSAAAVAAAAAVAKGGKAPSANDDQSDTTLPDEVDEAAYAVLLHVVRYNKKH